MAPPESTNSEQPSSVNGQLDSLLNKLRDSHQPGREARGSRRYAVSIPVPVVPIDEDGAPVDRPFNAVSRDISSSGICLLHTRATNAKHLAIVINWAGKKPIRLVVEVIRCRAVGRFYEIAAKFTSRMTEQTGQPSD